MISAAHFKVQQTFDLEACSAQRCHEAAGPESQPDNSPLQRNHQMINRISKLEYNKVLRPANEGMVHHRELSLQMGASADWRHTEPPCMADDLPAHILM